MVKRVLGVVAVAALPATLSACGTQSNYANNPRPPAPIVVTAAIGASKLSVSPSKFGAGPIDLVVTNLSSHPQVLTLDSADKGGATASVSQQTASIAPQDTARLKVTLPTGSYSLHVADGSSKAATLAVGPSRPSAQNELLQP